eukprot:538895-Pelagomonas_calceolata.AAC.1
MSLAGESGSVDAAAAAAAAAVAGEGWAAEGEGRKLRAAVAPGRREAKWAWRMGRWMGVVPIACEQ